jgi:L-amino acid N-acyltransferase
MIAGIDADNAVSIALHRSLGFSDVGHFREVGCKFGRWLDLVFMQCILTPTVDSPAK